MNYLKQSTSTTLVLGPFIDDADGKTAETGLTIAQADVRLSKAGGAFAQKNDATSATHMEFGYYSVPVNATDTATLGPLKVCVSEAGALPVFADYTVLAANVYDSLIGGGDLLQVDVSQFGGAAGTFASGRPEVNTTHAAGTAWNSGAIGATTLAADTLTAAKVASDVGTEIATAVWANGTRLLTAGTNIVLAKGTGVTGFNDLDAAGVRGAVGLASANLDTQIGTLATASALATVDTVVDAILVDTGTDIPGTLATLATAANLATVAGYIDTEIGTLLTNLTTVDGVVDAIKAKTDNLPAAPAAVGDIPTAAAIADAVWDEALSGHLSAGSTGEALDGAGGGGGGLDAAGVRAAIGLSSANLDTQLAKLDTIDDFLDTEIGAIKAKTDGLTFTVAGSVDANIQRINDVALVGDGAATPWGPA